MRPALVVLSACGRFGFAPASDGAGAGVSDARSADSGGADRDGANSDGADSDGAMAMVGCAAGETPGPFNANFDLGAPT